MRTYFRTLTAIAFSLLLAMMSSAVVFADASDISDIKDVAPDMTSTVPADLPMPEKTNLADMQDKDTNDDDNNDGDGDIDDAGDICNDNDSDDDENSPSDVPNDSDDDENFPSGAPDDSDDDNKPDDDKPDENKPDDDIGVVPSDPIVNTPPIKVSIIDFDKFYQFDVDEDGTARIIGLFNTFDPDAYGTESFVMVIDGKRYPITITSDGEVYGQLPEGYSIKNGELIITGLDADVIIVIEDHTMMSSISEGPDDEGSYIEPTKAPVPKRESEYTPVVNRYSYKHSQLPDEVTVQTNDEKIPAATDITAPNNEDVNLVMDAYDDASGGGAIPLAAGITLAISAATGLGVLLKLTLFAA